MEKVRPATPDIRKDDGTSSALSCRFSRCVSAQDVLRCAGSGYLVHPDMLRSRAVCAVWREMDWRGLRCRKQADSSGVQML